MKGYLVFFACLCVIHLANGQQPECKEKLMSQKPTFCGEYCFIIFNLRISKKIKVRILCIFRACVPFLFYCRLPKILKRYVKYIFFRILGNG